MWNFCISSIYDTKFGKRNEWTNLRIVHLSSLKWLIKEMRSQRGRGQGKRASEWEWKTKTLRRSKMWAKVYLLRWVKGSGLPAIPWLGVYPEETIIEKDKCTPVFTATLFTIARTWKQPRCPLTDEWIQKLWYIYTMECYSALKKNAFESVLMRWMNLEPIVQSEVSQKEKNKSHL